MQKKQSGKASKEEILNHLKNQELEIKFTKEEEENKKKAVLDLELNVNRERNKKEFSVHYKKKNTNITTTDIDKIITTKTNRNSKVRGSTPPLGTLGKLPENLFLKSTQTL